MNTRKLLKVRSGGRRAFILLAALPMLCVLVFTQSIKPALGMPRDPIDPDPIEINDPYPVPDNGFEWRMAARFGMYQNGIVDFNWIEDQAIYEPEHVNPNEFIAIFDGCQTWDEEETGTSQLTYRWTIDGQVTESSACRIQHAFPAQGAYAATLRITQADGSVLLDSQGRGDPFTQSIVVKDFLIVSIGDSYASGEGNPDRWQRLGGSDIFGQPTHVESAPVWQDRRCHRSAYAAPAQAARMLEAADPHSSVTFLSFACSGATISTHIYRDASWFDPYRPAEIYHYEQDMGTGILGPGSGQEPPNGRRPQDNQLPAQISQIVTALTNNGQLPARPVDALIISAGGNDMGFGNIAMMCTLYWDCENILVSHAVSGMVTLDDRFTSDLGTLPERYEALAADITTYVPFTENGRVYITQYPDLTRNSAGGLCDEMATDLIPWWLDVYLAADAAWEGAAYVPLLPFRMDHDEITWAATEVAPALNDAVADAAETHNWVLVDGINDSTANLFATHGYCASDNWVRTAAESVVIQGPWAAWDQVYLPPTTTLTKGTMHPTAQGLLAIAERIMAKMRPNLLPLPPAGGPALAPTFSSSNNNATISASGWFTGHEAVAACPSNAANCTFAQVVATSAAGTDINGASLLLNGAPIACSATGVTTGGLTCQAGLTTPQTFAWSLAFAADDVYQLGFSAGSNNGANATFNHQVKVDLTDPVASHELSSLPDASGWYRVPVTVEVTAADGAGSGPATIEYQLDGDSFVAGGNRTEVDVFANGVHTLSHRAADTAGRTSAWQTLTLQVDQLAPVSAATVSPADNGNGWHSAPSVAVILSAADSGGSGLAGLTYSASGAQPIASTTVNGASPVQLSITGEGVTTVSFAATDLAGNVEETQTIIVRLDRSAPVVNCAASDGLWHAGDVSRACTARDSGSGLAQASPSTFSLTTSVAEGSESSDAPTDSRTVCDVLDNCVTAGPLDGNKVDKKGPTVTITAPANVNYLLNESVTAGYNCADGGSGVATCSGPVANGTPVDTASPGAKSLTLSATDNVGNTASQSVSYNVVYGVCVLFDQTKAHKLGSTIPLKLQLCDAVGSNMSTADIVLNATGLTKKDNSASSTVEDTGNANPDSNFRFDPALGSYVFNLSTKGLSTGTWSMGFTVTNDPITHSVEFDVR